MCETYDWAGGDLFEKGWNLSEPWIITSSSINLETVLMQNKDTDKLWTAIWKCLPIVTLVEPAIELLRLHIEHVEYL